MSMIAADQPRTLLVALAIAATFLAGILAAGTYVAIQHLRAQRLARAGDPEGQRRDVLAMLGDALAATHNPQALLVVILDATVEATRAVGGEIRVGSTTAARVGERGNEPPLVLELDHDPPEPTELVLHPPQAGFSPETRGLAESIAMQGRIALENARLHRAVEQQAVTDDLTGLANRRRFIQALAGETRRCERFGGEFSVVLADLDDFKRINDTLGHEAGDVVLEAVATTISVEARGVDLVARIGGEEFGIVVPETDMEGAVAVAERIRDALQLQQIEVRADRILTVTASFGIATYRQGSTPTDLMRAADEALYRAKAQGKNCTVGAVH